MSIPCANRIWACLYNSRCQAYLLTSTCATMASVGRPERIRRSGAGAWTTAPAQVRQPYFGRGVTRIRCCAGMTSSRSDFSSPIMCIAPPQQGHDVVSGSMTTSTRGRCAGSDLRLPGSGLGRGARGGSRCLLPRGGLPMRAAYVAFFERELQLVGVEPLRTTAELRSLELSDQLGHPLDPAEQFVALGDQRQRRRPQAQYVSGKRVGRRHRSPASTLFQPAPLALLQAFIGSPAAAQSVVRAPAFSRAPRPRLPAAP